ncbi:MAG: hypothetical protein FK734_15425 [Asgard group archaeon]|nr:hypothetical protein [Asgard group archaeon]
MIIGLCIGVLDEKVGPTPIYSLHLDDELSKKLTMKIMLGVMSFTSDTDENSSRGESIIPFIKDKIITFAYMFPIKDSKARGGFRFCSLIAAFDIKDRILIYENATLLTRILKNISESIELKHIQTANFPMSISEKFNTIRSEIYVEKPKAIREKTDITITCPLCNVKNTIELPSITKGVKFIEHQIFANEICSHSFTVYLDSKFNILGYKDPQVEITEMKDMLGKLKSPYD